MIKEYDTLCKIIRLPSSHFQWQASLHVLGSPIGEPYYQMQPIFAWYLPATEKELRGKSLYEF